MDARVMAAGWTKGKGQILRNIQRPQGLLTEGWEGKQKVERDPQQLIKATATLQATHSYIQSLGEFK